MNRVSTFTLRITQPPSKPLLVYDGDCEFCKLWVARWREETGAAVDYAPFQEAAARFPEMPRAEFERAVQLIEPDGRSTARQAVFYCAALLPVSLAPTLIGLANTLYFAAALGLGLLFLVLTLKFARTRAIADARRLFFASIIYLPLIWTLMIVGRA